MLRATLLALMLALTLATPVLGRGPAPAAAQEASPTACPPGTEEANRAVVQRYYDLVDGHDFEGLRDVYAPVIYRHAADNPDAQGIDEAVNNLYAFLDAFPDLDMEVDQLLSDGDLVAARVFQSGTHEQDFFGVPATGNHATWTVIGIFKISCGLIAEQWVEVDQIGRLQQLGAAPVLGVSSPATPAAVPAVIASPMAECPSTTEAENAELIHRWFDEVWNQGDFTNFAGIVAADHAHHRVLNRIASGVDARERTVRAWREAFPDLSTTVEFLMTDGDRVVARWTATGANDGPWEGLAPTGNTVTWTGNTIFRIACGRIAEEWSEAASLDFFHQLGIGTGQTPPPPPASPAAVAPGSS